MPDAGDTDLATVDTAQTLKNKTIVGDDVHIVAASALAYGDSHDPQFLSLKSIDKPTSGKILAVSQAGNTLEWVDTPATDLPASRLATTGKPVSVSTVAPTKAGQALLTTTTEEATWQDLPPVSVLKAGEGTVSIDEAAPTKRGQILVSEDAKKAIWQDPPPAASLTNDVWQVDMKGVIPTTGQVLTALSATGASWQTLPPVSSIKSKDGLVSVDGNTPKTGQVLTAQSETAATWQNVPAVSSLKGDAGDVVLSSKNPTVGFLLTATSGTTAIWADAAPSAALKGKTGAVKLGATDPKAGQILVASDATDADWKDVPLPVALPAGKSSVSLAQTTEAKPLTTLVTDKSGAANWRAPPPLDEVFEFTAQTNEQTHAVTAATIPLASLINHVTTVVGVADANTGSSGYIVYKGCYKNNKGLKEVGDSVTEYFLDDDLDGVIQVKLVPDADNVSVLVDQNIYKGILRWIVRSAVIKFDGL